MNEARTAEAYEAIQRTVAHFLNVSDFLIRDGVRSREDLVQEVFIHFLEKDFFEKYDESVTSFRYFVSKAAKNHLIDMTRKRVHKMTSLDQPIRNPEGVEGSTLGEMIEENLSDPFTTFYLKELIQSCKDEQISPNYDLTWVKLLSYVMMGLTPSEIHGIIGISSGRISQLIRQLRTQFVEA